MAEAVCSGPARAREHRPLYIWWRDRSLDVTEVAMRAVRGADVEYARTKTEERRKRSKRHSP